MLLSTVTIAPDMLAQDLSAQHPFMPMVRRFEAVGFRSFPSGWTTFDGAWAVRLTEGHLSKRLNSVNPLDPGDKRDLEIRLAAAAQVFNAANRPLVVRATPLCPPELNDLMDREGWLRFDESIVMAADLAQADLADGKKQRPVPDRSRFVQACVAMGSVDAQQALGLEQVIGAVEGRVGLFMTQGNDATPHAAVMAVLFGGLLGLFQIVTNPAVRRQGHGRSLVRSAMAWGRANGARSAWLQVEANNEAACGLYASEGFVEMYRYDYCTPPKQVAYG